MKFDQIPPPLPTLAQYRRLRRIGTKRTVLRQMEYDLIPRLQCRGKVLDFGGGQKAEYLPLLPSGLAITSVNIDDEFAPTDIVLPGDPLPFPDNHFDTVITFNTLEHVYDDIGAINELWRVMKPGAIMHIIVPYMYPVHGHPYDYNRHTPGWWADTLERIGFAEATLTPVVFGRTTSARLIGGRGPTQLRPVTDFVAAMRDIVVARLRFIGKTVYDGRRGESVWAAAPAWYLRVLK